MPHKAGAAITTASCGKIGTRPQDEGSDGAVAAAPVRAILRLSAALRRRDSRSLSRLADNILRSSRDVPRPTRTGSQDFVVHASKGERVPARLGRAFTRSP